MIEIIFYFSYVFFSVTYETDYISSINFLSILIEESCELHYFTIIMFSTLNTNSKI